MTIDKTHLNNAITIADKLLDRAMVSRDIILWENTKDKDENSIGKEFDYSLSSGTSGIIFFYAELYYLTKDKKYLGIIKKAVNGLRIDLEKKSHFRFGLMNGISGVVFLFIKLFIITSKDEYLSLAKKYIKFISYNVYSDNLNNSLFDGRAGALLVILNLFLVTKDKDLLDNINQIARRIICDARFDKAGLNWYHSQTQASGLVGFGYGSVGISYVLSFLNNYTLNDDKLKFIFEGGIEYCNNQWNPKIANWPDYNIRIENGDEDKCLINSFSNDREKRIILKGKNSISFYDGYIGILFGLSYIEKRIKLSKEIKTLIIRARSSLSQIESKMNSILDLSAVLSIKLMNKENFDILYNEMEIDFSENQSGLAKGLAGKGYLELIATRKISNPYFSFLLIDANPEVILKETSIIDKTIVRNLYYIPFNKHYPNTMELIFKKNSNSALKELFWETNKIDFANFHNFVTKLVNANSANSTLRKVYRYETIRHQFYLKNKSCLKSFIDNYNGFVANKSLQKIKESELLNKTYVLNKNSKIILINYDISKIIQGVTTYKNEKNEKQKVYIILQFTDNESYIREEYLTDLDEIIINFKKPLKAGFVFESLIKQYGLESKKDLLQKRFINTLLKYVQNGMLVFLD